MPWTPRPSAPSSTRSTTWPRATPPSPSPTGSRRSATPTRSPSWTTATSWNPAPTPACSQATAVTPNWPHNPRLRPRGAVVDIRACRVVNKGGRLPVGAGVGDLVETTMIRRLAVALGAAGAAVTMLAGSAAASTGPAYYAPDQAGYTATGAHFKVVEVNAWLPDASRFSREIGRLGFSLEMLTPALVIDLSVYACTDSTCRPGGRPVTNRYRLAFKIYKRSTHALICSENRELDLPDGVPRAWNNARLAPGHRAGLSLFSTTRNGALFAAAGRYRVTTTIPPCGNGRQPGPHRRRTREHPRGARSPSEAPPGRPDWPHSGFPSARRMRLSSRPTRGNPRASTRGGHVTRSR